LSDLLPDQEANVCGDVFFESEFVAMKQCCEYLRGLRYKLMMMGIPMALATYVEITNKYWQTRQSQVVH
jgi:hypothetical protein